MNNEADLTVAVLEGQRAVPRFESDACRPGSLADDDFERANGRYGIEDWLTLMRTRGVNEIHQQAAIFASDTDVDVG